MHFDRAGPNVTGMKQIEYFYSPHSAFAYLGSARLMQICAENDAQLVHRPISLSPVVEAVSGHPFAGRRKSHVHYFFGREIQRWAEWREVPIISFRPTYHDAPYDLASGMILAQGVSSPETDQLAHAMLQAHWRDDADLSDPVQLAKLAQGLGLDAQALQDAAQSAPILDQYRANTAEAIARDVFGSPTYFVDGDKFYGQDRLEMVERALVKPFAGSR